MSIFITGLCALSYIGFGIGLLLLCMWRDIRKGVYSEYDEENILIIITCWPFVVMELFCVALTKLFTLICKNLQPIIAKSMTEEIKKRKHEVAIKMKRAKPCANSGCTSYPSITYYPSVYVCPLSQDSNADRTTNDAGSTERGQNTVSALEWAKYIVTICIMVGRPINNLDLQRVLYAIRSTCLKQGRRAFPEQFTWEQWGPVIKSVYYYFCGFGVMDILDTYDDVDIGAENVKVVAAVLLQAWEKGTYYTEELLSWRRSACNNAN